MTPYARSTGLANPVFLQPLLEGGHSADMIADTAAVLVLRPPDAEPVRQPLDALGVNYYSTTRVRRWDGPSARQTADGHKDMAARSGGADDVGFLPQPGPYTDMGWNIEPAGREVLVDLPRRYPALPLTITGNGAAFADEVVEDPTAPGGFAVHDAERVDYLRRHVTACRRAIECGVNLRGYLVWSLLASSSGGTATPSASASSGWTTTPLSGCPRTAPGGSPRSPAPDGCWADPVRIRVGKRRDLEVVDAPGQIRVEKRRDLEVVDAPGRIRVDYRRDLGSVDVDPAWGAPVHHRPVPSKPSTASPSGRGPSGRLASRWRARRTGSTDHCSGHPANPARPARNRVNERGSGP